MAIPALALLCATYVMTYLGAQFADKARFLVLQLLAYGAGRLIFARGEKPFRIRRLLEDLALLFLAHAIVRSMLENDELERSDPDFMRVQVLLVLVYSFLYPLARGRGGYQLCVLFVASLQLLPPYSNAFLIPVHTGSTAIVNLLIALGLICYSWLESLEELRLPPAPLAGLIAVYFCLAAFAVLHTDHLDAAVAHLLKTAAFVIVFLAFLQLQRDPQRYELFRDILFLHLGLQAAWFLIGWIRNPGAQTVGLVNLNTVAMLFEVFVFLAIYGVLRRKSPLIRAGLGVFICLSAVLIVLFESRGAYGGVLAGAGVWALAHFTRPVFRRPVLRTAAIVLGAGLILSVAVWVLLEYYLHVIGKERAVLWKLTQAGIFQSPWRALFGYGSFGPYFLFQHDAGFIAEPYLQLLPGWFWTVHPHSEYLSLLYGLGFSGFIAHFGLSFGLLFMADAAAIKDPARAYAGGALLGATVAIAFHGVVDPVSITIVTGLLFWILLAEAVNLYSPARQEQQEPERPPRKYSRTVKAAAAGAFILLAFGLTRYEIREAQLIKTLLPYWHRAGMTESFSQEDRQVMRENFDAYYTFLDRWSFSDESFRLYAEMNIATLPGRLSAADTAYAEELRKIEAAYCQAIRLRDYPLYYRRILRILDDSEASWEKVCGYAPEEFKRMERARDPYRILDRKTAPPG